MFFKLFRKKQESTAKRAIRSDPSWQALSANIAGISAVESIPAVAQAVSLLADSISALPPKIVEIQTDGRKTPINSHPVHSFLKRPNSWMSWSEVVSYVVRSVLLTGNAFLAIKDDELIPIASSNVSVRYHQIGKIYYDVSYQYPRWDSETLSQEQVIHFKYSSTNSSGTLGVSPLSKSQMIVQLAQQQIDMSLRSTQIGVYPSAVIKLDDQTLTEEEQDKIYEQTIRRYGGSKQFQSPLVISKSTEFTPIMPASAKEAQLLEARRDSVSEVARLFNVPEAFLNRLEYQTLANFRESSRILLRFSLHPHIVKFQQTFSNAMLEDNLMLILDQSEFVESKKERYENIIMLVKEGIITKEEARQIEGIL